MPLRKVIISGGGTGGHIFPAIAIANKIKSAYPDVDILFVGAEGKMEMEKVPKAGYKIEGLPIRGIQRKLTLKNLAVPFKLIASLIKARKIIKKFNPDVAIGVGGYASAATIKVAARMKIPTLIQEQNGFPGVTNKVLGKTVDKICVAYDGLEAYFPQHKIVKTGNPVRAEVVQIEGKRESAFKKYELDPNKKTILSIGGSLGARTLNESIQNDIQKLLDKDYQLIWQCGSYYKEQLTPFVEGLNTKNIHFSDFIFDMDHAYAAADLIISRAGAISVSEVCLIGKPVILVPSPNVAEDHQTKNAMALVDKDAAVLIKDNESKEKLIDEAIKILEDDSKCQKLSKNIKELGIADATDRILKEIEKLVM